MLKIYNTLSRKKEEFSPRVPGKVSMYTCGPTVYDNFHIGNARTFVMGDTLRRILAYLDYDVTYVQNFTDIDDKIIARANQMGVTMNDLVEEQIKAYYRDADDLNILRADHHPRVTEHVEAIISYIETLISAGHAYAGGGDVFFSVASYPGYGELSGQKLEDLDMGSRVDVDDDKRHPADFVLWKGAKAGEPAWESPWGSGRPGWHIECSVMVKELLGGSIDIHAGGMDLKFPHHENERAQSEVLSGDVPYVRYWAHVAFLNIRNSKMSKSQNNFFTARELLDKYDGSVLRFFLQSAHYRKPLNYDEELVASAAQGLARLQTAVDTLRHYSEHMGANEAGTDRQWPHVEDSFRLALADDFNTAEAWAVLFEFAREMNTKVDKAELSGSEAAVALALLERLAGVLGVKLVSGASLEEAVEELIRQRQEARKAKNFARADEIRDELAALGIVLEDTPQGVRWRKK